MLIFIGPTLAQRDYTFVTGNWRGQAHYKDSGAFKSCTMAASYKSGTELYFVIDEKLGWVLGMTNPDWTFKTGKTKEVEVTLDSRHPLKAELTVLSANGFSILFQDQQAVLETFKNSRELKLVFEAFKARFELKKTRHAVQDLINCALARSTYIEPPERNPKRPVYKAPASKETETSLQHEKTLKEPKGQENKVQTNEQKGNEPKAHENLGEEKKHTTIETPLQGEQTDEKRQKAFEITKKILKKNGFSGYELADIKDHTRSGFDVMWTFSDKTYGGLSLVLNGEALDLEKEAAKIISENSMLCKETFASVKKSPSIQDLDNRQIRIISIACDGVSGASKLKYALIKYPNKFWLKIAHGTPLATGGLEQELPNLGKESWMMPEEDIFSQTVP